MDRASAIAELRALPDHVADTCAGLDDAQIRRRPADGEWSLLEIACHLRDYAEEEGLRVRRIIEEDNPELQAWDEQQRAAERRYLEEDPRRVLTTLRAFWTGLAYRLEHLSDSEWQRRATHPERGAITPAIRLEHQAAHAQTHLQQMRATRNAITPA